MTENKNSKAIAELYAWLLRIGSKLEDSEQYLKKMYDNELEVIKKITLLRLAVQVWVDDIQKLELGLSKLPLESIFSILNNQFNFDELNFENNHSEFDFQSWFNPFIRFEEELILLKTNLNKLEIDSGLMKEIEEIILLTNELIEIIEDFV